MRVSSVFAVASLILVTASATACSGGSGSASAPAASTSTSSAATSGSSTSSSAGNAGAASSVKNFNVCKALPAAAASHITGTTFTTTKSSSVEGVVFSCEYGGPNSALLQVSIQTQAGKDGLETDVSSLKTVGYAPDSITGVGDEAFSEPDPKGNAGAVGASSFASYGALFGQTYIKIGGLTYVTADQGKQIVNELHSKL